MLEHSRQGKGSAKPPRSGAGQLRLERSQTVAEHEQQDSAGQ